MKRNQPAVIMRKSGPLVVPWGVGGFSLFLSLLIMLALPVEIFLFSQCHVVSEFFQVINKYTYRVIIVMCIDKLPLP